MEAPMTPTTALLYAFLEPDVFDTPLRDRMEAEDVFSQAFSQYSCDLTPKSPSIDHTSILEYEELNTKSVYVSPYSLIQTKTELPNNSTSPDSFEIDSKQIASPSLYDCSALLRASKESIINSSPSVPRSQSTAIVSEPITKVATFPCAPTKTKKPPKSKKRSKPYKSEEDATKHEAFLERNRLAALKCRSNKKSRVEKLVGDVKLVMTRNLELKDELWGLLNEVKSLRELVQEHVTGEKVPSEEEQRKHCEESGETLEEDEGTKYSEHMEEGQSEITDV